MHFQHNFSSVQQVHEKLEGGWAEIVFCTGFLIVYLADELLHLICGEAIQHSHASHDESQAILPTHHNHSHASYGTNGEQQKTENNVEKTATSSCAEHQNQHDREDETINARICHTNHTEPCGQTLVGIIGMLFALSIHSLLEGLAIGIQDTTPKVMILFTAVISHKLVVAFCLGVELTTSSSKFINHFMAIFVFTAGSVVGILIGMGLVDLKSVSDSNLLPVLQGIAGGTLLYVTLCEVLPREKARWHQNRTNKVAGLSQFLAFTTGFTVMTLMNIYISDGD
jgi:solute carrier family 39 (zinc transporter), member 1/2/3